MCECRLDGALVVSSACGEARNAVRASSQVTGGWYRAPIKRESSHGVRAGRYWIINRFRTFANAAAGMIFRLTTSSIVLYGRPAMILSA